MTKSKAPVLNPAHLLRLSLIINPVPLQPLITHLRAAYPDLMATCPLTETSLRIHLINRLPAAPHLLPIYKSLFTSITKDQKEFDLVFKSLQLKVDRHHNSLLAKTQSEGQKLERWNQEIYDVLQKKKEFVPRGRKPIHQDLKFKTNIRIFRGLEREKVDEVVKDLNGRFGDGKDGAMSVGATVVGLELASRWPERFEEWREGWRWDLKGGGDESEGEERGGVD